MKLIPPAPSPSGYVRAVHCCHCGDASALRLNDDGTFECREGCLPPLERAFKRRRGAWACITEGDVMN